MSLINSTIPSSGVDPTAEQFAQLFPFHIAFDGLQQITQIGPGLQRVCPHLVCGNNISDAFRLRKPVVPFTVEALRQQQRSVVLLDSLQSSLQLRGQMLYMAETDTMVFLGSPWITSVTALEQQGLSLGDFATHDPVVDYLFLFQAQSTALAETKQLSNQLMQQRAELRASEHKYRTVVDNLHEGIFHIDQGRKWTFLNPAWTTITGYAIADSLDTSVLQYVHADDQRMVEQRLQAALQEDRGERCEVRFVAKTGDVRIIDMYLQAAHTATGQSEGLAGTLTDITETRRAAEERLHLQEEIIQAQAARLDELSTPLIAITPDVLVLPLVGSVDGSRAARIIETVLEGVSKAQANTVILDITGVPVVDTVVAQAIVQTSQAAKLVGARLIVTGIRPEVAQTLVALGITLRDLVTFSSLHQAITITLQQQVTSPARSVAGTSSQAQRRFG
jgi:anti-anti-sigma factor